MATPENDKQPIMNDEDELEDNEQEAVENNEQEVVENNPKKRLKSAAWNHFDLIFVDGVRRWAKCVHCKKQLTGRSNDGTTHLKDHYRICVGKNTRDIRQHILVQGQKTVDGKAYMSKYSFDAEVSRDELAKMIIIHDYPLSIVEHYGFRKYTKSLQPLFKVPCRNTVKGDIMKIKKCHILKCFEENASRIALTSDMWTASNQKKGYMAITAHYIDVNWKLQNQIMSFIHVPSPHTADALSQAMMECFLEWNIDNKLSTLTLDNCSTNDAIVDKLLGTLTTSSLILKGRIFHMRCCAHIINLIVQDGFSVIANAIENVRNSVSYWTSSPKRAQDFRLFARQVGVNCQKELLLDCKTRWNSIYMMLSVALEYKEVFNRLSKKDKHYVCLPSEDEWNMASNVCEKLKLFYQVTEKFSGTKYPTSNIFFPLICDMKLSLLSWSVSDNNVIKSMASTMLTKFEKYWNVIHNVMSVAIVLDPRYKLKLINYFFPKLYGNEARSEIMQVRNIITELFEEYKKKHNAKQGASWKRQCETNVFEGRGFTLSKSTWELDFENMLSEDDGLEKTELDDYLAEKLLPNEEGFDILMWWKCNGSKFPILQKIARDILAIPISSVASESAFSMSGNKVTKQRNRLKAETVGVLMCSQSWLRKELQGKKQGEPKAFDQTVAYDEDVE
uniref:BED-type domain-containing protein n=1 Tax=Lactuca sativa TaxID=4236 RepID=A0A9R1V9M5_LACSA|nr:hypothetical protein LSAT_V11C600333530 [Lactuca sativa]